MKRIGFLGLAVGLAVVVFLYYGNGLSMETPLEQGAFLARAYKAAGPQALEGYTVYDVAVLSSRMMALPALETLGKSLNGTLEIHQAEEWGHTDPAQNVFQLRGKFDDRTQASLILTSLQPPDGRPQTTLVIRVESDGPTLDWLSHTVRAVHDTVLAARAKPDVRVAIRGWRDGRMNPADQNRLVGRMLAAVGARVVASFESRAGTVVTAYSPLCKEYIDAGGQRVNIQVAVQYDASIRQTLVQVGSPSIPAE